MLRRWTSSSILSTAAGGCGQLVPEPPCRACAGKLMKARSCLDTAQMPCSKPACLRQLVRSRSCVSMATPDSAFQANPESLLLACHFGPLSCCRPLLSVLLLKTFEKPMLAAAERCLGHQTVGVRAVHLCCCWHAVSKFIAEAQTRDDDNMTVRMGPTRKQEKYFSRHDACKAGLGTMSSQHVEMARDLLQAGLCQVLIARYFHSNTTNVQQLGLQAFAIPKAASDRSTLENAVTKSTVDSLIPA